MVEPYARSTAEKQKDIASHWQKHKKQVYSMENVFEKSLKPVSTIGN